jgi:hypothetical protein
MPQIVTKSYFNKSNGLYIPMSVEHPTSPSVQASPNFASALDLLCIKVEKEILLNALGLSTYTTLQLALADIDNPLYASYKKLVQGDSYDDKVWSGLTYDYSLIAYRVYELFRTSTESQTTSTGEAKVNTQNSNHYSPAYKIAEANQQFLKQYQGGYCHFPIVSMIDGVEFIDWYGENNDVNISLYHYMNDKKADFTDFDIEKFKIYGENEFKNSFGL